MPDGSIRWQRWSDRAIFGPSGTITEYQSVGRDITKEKATEAALQESEIRFREQYQNNPLAIFTWQHREGDFVLVDCNRAAEALTGGRSKNFIGRRASELYATRPEIVSDFRHCFSDQAVIRKELTSEHFLPGRFIFTTAAYVPPDLIMVHLEDITERRQAEEALRESREKFQSLYMHMIEGAALHELTYTRDGIPEDYIIIETNPAFGTQLGISRDTVIGKTSREAYGVPEPPFLDIYANVALTGTPEVFETYFPPLGKYFSISAYSPAKGRFATIFEDITERKRAEEALRQANRKLNLLSGITRHDIRNQLMALNAYIDLSIDAIDKPAELKDFFARELKITDVLAEQIRFTKDYEDLGVKSPVLQDVGALVRYAGAELPMGNVRLDIHCPGLEIFADPLLEKVFYNLIDNSLHYGGNAMTIIRVTAREDGDSLRIIYEDDGAGITVEDKTQLFAKGFGRHTGLGLFLSREILSITGITITETGEPGKGARFEITVPKGAWRIAGNGI